MRFEIVLNFFSLLLLLFFVGDVQNLTLYLNTFHDFVMHEFVMDVVMIVFLFLILEKNQGVLLYHLIYHCILILEKAQL